MDKTEQQVSTSRRKLLKRATVTAVAVATSSAAFPIT